MPTIQYTRLLFTFTLLFSSLTTISLSASITKQRCHPNDYKVLMQIKKSLNNPYHLASWVPKTDCCEWYCLQCDETTSRVRSLLIFNGEISGQIPAAVGDLPYLIALRFEKLSNITGPIPRSITKLNNLKFLTISWLNLTGPIPDFLSELPNLEYIELNYNQFSGSIPPSFSKFTKLQTLHLEHNKLTGTIPDSFGHFTGSVPFLFLSHNQLTGTIPKSFANMDFERIDLSHNKLVGDASMLFKPNGSTQALDISRNMLEFDFSKVKFPKKSLTSLDINHNKIYGSIPKDIVHVEHLQTFNVSYNSLCGVIPTGGDRMARFDYSSYIHNKCLCGTPLKKCT